MDASKPIFKLEVITLLDSICYGLIYGFISPYLLSLGADNFTIGILAVGNLLCSLISADIINNLTQIHGKRYSLFLIFNIAMVSHLLMVLTNSYWCAIFARYIFSIINQSQNLCKDLLLKNTPKDEHDYFLTRFSILSALGFIIGPFISGSLFSIGFLYVGLLAAALTLANIFLIKSIPKGTDDLPPQLDERSFVEKSWENVIDTVDNFKKSDYKKNWDIIAIKYLYISSITIFFSKFTQILKHNFDATPFVIGYTSSYMSSLTFAGTYFATNIKDHISNYSVLTLTEYALVVAGTTQLLACYSPVYNLYAIMCIPIIFSTSFINSMWKDLFSIRGNESLKKVNSSVGILSGLTIPLIFGIVCNTIGHHAVIIFSVIPIIVSLFVINKYTKQYKLVEQENKKSKDE